MARATSGGSSSSGRSGCCSTGSRPGARRSRGAAGWNEALYRTWYLTGAVWTAGWLGLGTAFLLGRTRFGYSFALVPVPGRPVHVPDPAPARLPGRRQRADPVLHRAGRAGPGRRGRDLLPERALAQCWPPRRSSGRRVLSVVPDRDDDPARARLRPRPERPACPDRRRCSRGTLRLLTPFMNITGALRADPRRRLLDVRVHAQAARPALLARPEPAGRRVPVQPASSRRWRSPVNFVASLPGAVAGAVRREAPQPRAGDDPHRHRRLHRRRRRHPEPVRDHRMVPARASSSACCSCSPGSSSRSRSSARSAIPFTSIRLGRTRHEPAGAERLAAAAEVVGRTPTRAPASEAVV